MASTQVPGADTVEYCIFPQIPEGIKDENAIQYLEAELDKYLAYLSKHIVGYIWQNHSFNLRVVSPKTGQSPGHLYGAVCYGDNVEDEWFVIYLLFQLSRKFSGAVAKVWDFDGEVLLIEAAESLPKWLNPDTAENRVFIYNGDVHVIPIAQTPAQLTQFPQDKPSLQQAVDVIRAHSSSTRAAAAMQKDIGQRIQSFPLKASEHVQLSNCYMPAALAAVLEREPSLLGPMVQAFYHRDPSDLKSCITFTHFRPGTRVLTRVKFTKCLYAQLMQQQFTADRRSGFSIPPPKSPDFKANDLGMKVAHGAEILCSKCPNPSNVTSSYTTRVHRDGPRWRQFVESLTKFGYFAEELEGSLKYNKLLDEAEKYFGQSVNATSISEEDPGSQILQVLKSAKFDIEDMRQKGAKLPPSDNDDWLNLTPEMLDDMLRKVSGKTEISGSEFDPSLIPENMKTFMGAKSSHEGAENPDDEIHFDPDSFMQTTQKLFDFDKDDYESDSSSLDEYDSDDDLADSLSPSSPGKGRPNVSRNKPLHMDDYMELMDRELAGTHIGTSFEKHSSASAGTPVAPPRKKKGTPSSAPQVPEARKVPPKRPPPPATKPSRPLNPQQPKAATFDDDIDDLDDDDFKPVDVDINLVKNFLESYGAQEGLPGPASNMLGNMGVKLPPKADDM